MKRFPYFALLTVLLLVSACVVPGLAATTPTAVPANTQQPTSTSAPTATSTSTPVPPTATPDAAATKAAQSTQAANDVLSYLDDTLGDTEIPYKSGHLVWKQTDPITIDMDGPTNSEIAGIGDEEITAKNFILKFDATWEATSLLVCGAIFRSEPDLAKGKQYQFAFLRFSGLPAWDIAVYEFGRFKNTPTKTKFSDALDLSNGATNKILLAVQDDHFTLYINDTRQGTYYDYSKQRLDGSFGFIGSQDSGKGSCQFENSWVWTLE